MAIDSALPNRRPHCGTSIAPASTDRLVPVELAADVSGNASPTFSHAVDEHQLGTAAIDTLIEQLPVGVLVAERGARVVYANTAARRLGVHDFAPLRWMLTRALLTEEGVREEALEFPEPSARRSRLRLTITLLRSALGAVVGAVVTVADTTAERRIAQWAPIMESLTNL